MIKILILVGVIGLLISVGGVSALKVDYYYSPNCLSCNQINPFIYSLQDKYNFHQWNFFNVQEENHNIKAVPTLVIGSKKIVGTQDIFYKAEARLNCNPNIEPQSYQEGGLFFTKATPNHQRPCSAPILFGGKE